MLKSKRVKLPGFFARKSMFELMHDYLTENDFYPVSVWGFKKGNLPEFSSVSRLNYIGFGASAATKTKGAFYMNTFSVPHYIEKIGRGKFAEVVKWEFTSLMDSYYYLYWKLYETEFSIDEFNKRFSGSVHRRVHALLQLLLLTGMIKREGNFYKLTKRGMFYVHLAQNYFSMRYINNVWSEMMHNAEPKEILL
jgi:coproporphyrinogen III oxidase-like Fe-S oxidoreductase